jgi:anti-sigma B factor antagonist
VPNARDFMPQHFELQPRMEADALVLPPRGDLDIATAPRLAAAIDELPAHVRKVVVDLRGVTFVDSSGLRGLLLVRRRTREAGIELVVVHDPEVHGPIFRLTQLDEELPLVVADA